MSKQPLNVVDGPSKYNLLASLGAGETNQHGHRLPVIMHLGGLGAIHMFIDQLARGSTTAGAENDDVLHGAADVWHFNAYVTDSKWPHLRMVEGVYATDLRKGRLFVEDKPAYLKS